MINTAKCRLRCRSIEFCRFQVPLIDVPTQSVWRSNTNVCSHKPVHRRERAVNTCDGTHYIHSLGFIPSVSSSLWSFRKTTDKLITFTIANTVPPFPWYPKSSAIWSTNLFMPCTIAINAIHNSVNNWLSFHVVGFRHGFTIRLHSLSLLHIELTLRCHSNPISFRFLEIPFTFLHNQRTSSLQFVSFFVLYFVQQHQSALDVGDKVTDIWLFGLSSAR